MPVALPDVPGASAASDKQDSNVKNEKAFDKHGGKCTSMERQVSNQAESASEFRSSEIATTTGGGIATTTGGGSTRTYTDLSLPALQDVNAFNSFSMSDDVTTGIRGRAFSMSEDTPVRDGSKEDPLFANCPDEQHHQIAAGEERENSNERRESGTRRDSDNMFKSVLTSCGTRMSENGRKRSFSQQCNDIMLLGPNGPERAPPQDDLLFEQPWTESPGSTRFPQNSDLETERFTSRGSTFRGSRLSDGSGRGTQRDSNGRRLRPTNPNRKKKFATTGVCGDEGLADVTFLPPATEGRRHAGGRTRRDEPSSSSAADWKQQPLPDWLPNASGKSAGDSAQASMANTEPCGSVVNSMCFASEVLAEPGPEMTEIGARNILEDVEPQKKQKSPVQPASPKRVNQECSVRAALFGASEPTQKAVETVAKAGGPSENQAAAAEAAAAAAAVPTDMVGQAMETVAKTEGPSVGQIEAVPTDKASAPQAKGIWKKPGQELTKSPPDDDSDEHVRCLSDASVLSCMTLKSVVSADRSTRAGTQDFEDAPPESLQGFTTRLKEEQAAQCPTSCDTTVQAPLSPKPGGPTRPSNGRTFYTEEGTVV